jgi:hypothetical protein
MMMMMMMIIIIIIIKVKLSLFLTKHHTMKTYWRSGGIAPRIPDLGTTWRSVVSFTPRPLYPQGKSPWYPLDRRLGGAQSRSGHGGEDMMMMMMMMIGFPCLFRLRINSEARNLFKYAVRIFGWGIDPSRGFCHHKAI